MEVSFYPAGSLEAHRFAVVLAHCKGEWLLSRHRKRETWEIPGGHIEPGETALKAARRELYEETGALDFSIRPLTDYTVGEETEGGTLFLAEIFRLGALPESEIAECRLFSSLPENLTYPQIQPKLMEHFLTSEEL